MIHSNPIIEEDIYAVLSEPFNWDSLQGKSFLITGANGFIASYILWILAGLNETRLKHNPVRIFALVRNREKAQQKLKLLLNKEYFNLIVADVSSPLEINIPLDIVIHTASQASPKYYGKDPVGTLKANTLGTANMLELAKNKNIQKFIFVSSGEVYGVIDKTLQEIPESYTGNVDITNIRSCYAESKRMGETMCVCWSHQYNFHVNMLRLSHTYGPGIELDDGRVFADFVKNVINNEDIVLNSDGTAKRSFVYITDMIVALFTVLFKGEIRQAYNVAGEYETEILELAKMLCGLYPQKNLYIKFSETVNQHGYIKSPSTGASMSIKKIAALGWRQKISVERGFYRMIESYKGNIEYGAF